MRYIFILIFLFIGLVANTSLLIAERTEWEVLSILVVDAGLVLGFYGIYLNYWKYEHLSKKGKIKSVSLFIGWLGIVFTTLGAYTFISGNYYLEGDRYKTAIFRQFLNFIGEALGPWAVSCFWLAIGAIAIFYSYRGYKKA